MALPPTGNALKFIINHVVLPPLLPHSDDASPVYELELVRFARIQAIAFEAEGPLGSKSCWGQVVKMLSVWLEVKEHGFISKGALIGAMSTLSDGDSITIHIKCQNAGLTLRKNSQEVICECFEVSPTAEAVMASQGRLSRSFPGRAMQIPASLFTDSEFSGELADFLCRLDSEQIDEVMPESSKANIQVVEERDTADPKLVTQLLMAILAPYGRPVRVRSIEKHIRDEIFWDRAKLPWRRSAVWQTIKVAIQLCLVNSGLDESLTQYKNYMAFLTAKLSQIGRSNDLPSHLLFVINAKIARRASKMATLFDFVEKTLTDSVRKTRTQIEKNTATIQAIGVTSISKIESVHGDNAISLNTSRPLLLRAIKRQMSPEDRKSFSPSSPAYMSRIPDLLPVPKFDEVPEQELAFALAEVEMWVDKHLKTWLQGSEDKQIGWVECSERFRATYTGAECQSLKNLAIAYTGAAIGRYQSFPEHMSLMLLIVMELWCSVDVIVCGIVPLVKQYSPEIPVDILEPLLLRGREHLLRLRQIELYLAKRHREAVGQFPSVFGAINKHSLAVKYFELSDSMHHLRGDIEFVAASHRERKNEELLEKNNNYNILSEEAAREEHIYQEKEDGTHLHSLDSCLKCYHQGLADSLDIRVHEWPLPLSENQAKATVFELRCPSEIAAWRDTTWHIVHDLGRCDAPKVDRCARIEEKVFKYENLKPWCSNQISRISIGSRTKSFYRSHYSKQRIPSSPDYVLLPNGLTYETIDTSDDTWTVEQSVLPKFTYWCNSQLPNGPYSNLQWSVNSTTHTQNEVISMQMTCPNNLTLDEFVAFGSLRAGERLQWYNILRELGSLNMNFNADEVRILLIQAAWQAGSPSDTELRTSHVVFASSTFCTQMHKMLSKVVAKIEASWNALNSMRICAILSLRLLSFTNDLSVVETTLELLAKIRKVALQWTQDLVPKIHYQHISTETHIAQQRLLMAALTCRLTYFTDQQHLSAVLQRKSDVATFVECSILIHDNSPEDISRLPFDLQQALLEDQKLAHFVESKMHRLALEGNAGITEGIARFWHGSNLPDSWTPLSPPLNRWLQTNTVPLQNSIALQVHYDLLTGKLLVEGRRLGRLPSEYIQHALYKKIFGAAILDVVTADEIGMSYRTTRLYSGYTVYFGMENATRSPFSLGNHLSIQIRSNASHLEVVPAEIFHGDLPWHLISEYAHWLDHNTGTVEFRPIQELWASKSEHWRLSCPTHRPTVMSQGSTLLVDPRSRTFNRISEILKPIEGKELIQVVTNSATRNIEVDLPRFRLRFLVGENGQLECPELGTVVDQNQAIGTLYGLESRLVMHGQGGPSSKHRRSVLIPFGAVSLKQSGDGTQVQVKYEIKKNVPYFLYQLDPHLRQVKSSSSATAHFYKVYLHAVTSLLLPDSFTGRTGVEEALSCLLETGAWSCAPLSEDVLILLNMVARLTPVRTFYPKHLQRMQVVEWNPALHPLVQHTKFHELVSHIIRYNNRFVGLHGTKALDLPRTWGSTFLQLRAAQRHTTYYAHEMRGLMAFKAKDRRYYSRDSNESTSAAQRSFEFAYLIKERPPKFVVCCDLWPHLAKLENFDLDQPFIVSSISDLLTSPLGKHWSYLYSRCRESNGGDKFALTFLFCTIAYGKNLISLELRSLLAIAFMEHARLPQMPEAGMYKLAHGHQPQKQKILEIIRYCAVPEPITSSVADALETRVIYNRQVLKQSEDACNKIMLSWPCSKCPILAQRDSPLLNLDLVTGRVGTQLKIWLQNQKLFEHFENYKPLLREISTPDMELPTLFDCLVHWTPPRTADRASPVPNLDKLLQIREAPSARLQHDLQLPMAENRAGDMEEPSNDLENILSIISDFSLRNDGFRLDYGKELLSSLKAFNMMSVSPPEPEYSCSLEDLRTYRSKLERFKDWHFGRILEILQPRPAETRELLLSLAGLWPYITPRTLLSRLSYVHYSKLHDPWRRSLLAYADSIVTYQKGLRLLTSSESGDHLAFCKEVRNSKNNGWSPYEQPDWRLMEIENDFLIRPIQARVAYEMIAPSAGNKNFVMQLNMGEGKSSVIIPMLACALADGNKLARCIVLKPLSKQMEHLLSQRLGGLIGRRVFCTPFSRKTELDSQLATNLRDIYSECKTARGILLTQPEHILSFKLMTIDRLYSKDFKIAVPMMTIQTWLEENCRDILDESDELLHANFELSYTLGSQILLDGQPARWVVVQSLLSLTAAHACSLHKQYPQGIEWSDRGPGAFPTCRILEEKVGAQLMTGLTVDIINGRIPGLRFDHCGKMVQDAAAEFISNRSCCRAAQSIVMRSFQDTEQLQIIILLRGLIGHGIMNFCLQRKRWLVNYGLDPRRCLMAVPYRAKSTPSVSAEFAQPDVAITLTCLSYYYSGLTDQQLGKCFIMLSKMTDPSLEYYQWQQHSALPAELRDHSGVNLEDDDQWNRLIFPHLRLNKKIVDFFLSRVVFSSEGREFGYKLSTSAWDLPANSAYSMTSGFSGTNDNQLLLPLSIQQRDLSELKHTSAMVLNTLLRKENRECELACNNGKRLSINGLIELVVSKQPPVRVLLDVGAQLLEINNQEIIENWLRLASDAKAGIFFDESDELMVLDREGKLERLFASSFRSRIGECVIYLDEAHTRGTDIHFPLNYRAAVTLGPELTKDRFVQACMRMRNLGHGQSVCCFVPPEVQNSILKFKVSSHGKIDISDVIRWTLEQTIWHIERDRSLWVAKGLDHTNRRLAHSHLLAEVGSKDADSIIRSNALSGYLKTVRKREAKTLREMYSESQEKATHLPAGIINNRDDPIACVLLSEWRGLDESTRHIANLHEEQEREVAHEVHQTNDIERPKRATPCHHEVDKRVTDFIQSGSVEEIGRAKQVFGTLQNTSVKAHIPYWLKAPVYASGDFIRTVKDDCYDEYLRPVNWVLVGDGTFPDLMLISPFEANELLPRMRDCPLVSLNIYSPRISKSMPPALSQLTFLRIGGPTHQSSPKAESLTVLNLFAGSLCFQSYQEYQNLCEFLGLVGGRTVLQPGVIVSSDGFVDPASRELLGWGECVFANSPMPLIRALLSIRRKGCDWDRTDMGHLVDAMVLKAEDFEEEGPSSPASRVVECS